MYRFLLFFLFAFALGCSSDDNNTVEMKSCDVSAECDAGEICKLRQCVLVTGTECDDVEKFCPNGYRCANTKCEAISSATDIGTDAKSGNNNAPDVGASDDASHNNSNDIIPPKVISFEPADGASNVAIDVMIMIEMSEALFPVTVNTSAFKLFDTNNKEIEFTPEYIENSTTIKLKPKEALLPSSSYRIEVTQLLKDKAYNAAEPVSATFYTVFKENSKVRMLAEKY